MKRLQIPRLGLEPSAPFPPLEAALREPDGLLAVGGDLSPTRLLNAYGSGIFPWYSEGQPILWWSPDPRMLFESDRFELPSRFRRQLRRSEWTLCCDTAFLDVMVQCATVPRAGQDGTWITDDMLEAYYCLHRMGHAHSVEVFDGSQLVGGIYGVAIGEMFFGESMFSREPGASKVALAGLLKLLKSWQWPWLDAQVENPHLRGLGATLVPRPAFSRRVAELTAQPGRIGAWTAEMAGWRAADLAKSLD